MTDLDRRLAERVKSYTGHVEDMGEDERTYLLAYLAEAVLRLLDEAEVRPARKRGWLWPRRAR